MKKLISLIMATVMCASVFAGCGNSDETTDGAQTTAKDAVTSTADTKDKFKGENITLYARWMEDDTKWITDEVLPAFEKEYGATVNLAQYESPFDLPDILNLDQKTNTIGLVFTTTDVIPTLAKSDLIIPISDVDSDIQSTLNLYSDPAIAAGNINDIQYTVAADMSTYMMMYSKSAVADAVANWETVKDGVNKSLKEYNNYGLPNDYSLEADPNQWDNYDLAVAGYYWANTEINGMKSPKIAHRGKMYEATGHEVFNTILRMGGTNDDILSSSTGPVYDALEWEDYLAQSGTFISAMWEEGWSGGKIYEGWASGSVYLAFMHNSDAFTVHGNGTDAMQGYFADPDDMGLAMMPSGVSLEMEDGEPARVGAQHSSVSFSWGYVIPTTTPNEALSYELFKWLMKDEYQTHWAQVGRIPTTKNLEATLADNLSEQWMKDVYDVSYKQLAYTSTMPFITQLGAINTIYCETWKDIVSDGKKTDIKSVVDTYAKNIKDELSK